MNEDQLIDIISEVTTLLGAALAQYIELNESIAGASVESQKLKVDALKSRMADEKLKLAKLKDAAKRRRELEKSNHETPSANEGKTSSPMLTLTDAAGKVVGIVRVGKDRTVYFSRTGKLVAREIGGATYDLSQGDLFAARGRLGLRVLAQR